MKLRQPMSLELSTRDERFGHEWYTEPGFEKRDVGQASTAWGVAASESADDLQTAASRLRTALAGNIPSDLVQQPSAIQRTAFWDDRPVLWAPQSEDLSADTPDDAKTVSQLPVRTISMPDHISPTQIASATRTADSVSSGLAPIPESGLMTETAVREERTQPVAAESCAACPRGLFSDWLPCDPCRSDTPYELPTPSFLACRGIDFGGWIEAGAAVVANRPVDRYNGVVTFADRNAEPQLNQLWFFLDKPADNQGCGWAWGGHVDFLYGTDARFTQATDGLESDWGQTSRFYQVALPQFYVDLAYNDWNLRMGHFYTILGYEVVQAPKNFFYTHAYSHHYGEPFTHTGLLLSRKLNDQWAFSAGLHRGNDQFDDTDGQDALGFLGGVNWTSRDERVALAFALSADEFGPQTQRVIFSTVATWNISSRSQYVFQWDWGNAEDAQGVDSQWYGINQYFFYTINPCWKFGSRIEWFRDTDGTRVTGIGDGNLVAGASFPGDFYEITVGLNWSPRPNILVRPELRWDWYEPRGNVATLPYDSGDRDDQFLFGCDFILTF
ncbi:porin [Thermopirellula anaerolimosa]